MTLVSPNDFKKPLPGAPMIISNPKGTQPTPTTHTNDLKQAQMTSSNPYQGLNDLQ